MTLTKKFFCPMGSMGCSYRKKDNSCAMVDDGDDPVFECDAAAYFYNEDEDYFVWEDENGNRYNVQELLEMGYHFVNGEPIANVLEFTGK